MCCNFPNYLMLIAKIQELKSITFVNFLYNIGIFKKISEISEISIQMTSFF